MLCGLGCNTLPGERYGSLRRIRNRYHGEINRYFLCDRGRFGYEFVNSPPQDPATVIRIPRRTRMRTPSRREQATEHVAALLKTSSRAIGIGSPRASLEANHALRTLVGAENFFIGIDSDEAGLVSSVVEILSDGPARTPSLRDDRAAPTPS